MMSLGRLRLAVACTWLLSSAACKRTGQSTGETWRGTAPSCKALAATCGPSNNENCSKSLRVDGGTFTRSYDGVDFLDPGYPATVSDFYLDKYEVTVGRFRAFANVGSRSPKGDGKWGQADLGGNVWEWTLDFAGGRSRCPAAIVPR